MALEMIAAAAGAGLLVGGLVGKAVGGRSPKSKKSGEVDFKAAALLDACEGIVANHSEPDSLARAVRAIVHLAEADAGSLMLLDSENKSLMVAEAAYSINGEFEFPQSLAVGLGLAGQTASTGRETRVTPGRENIAESSELDNRFKAAIAIPLTADMRPGGGAKAESRLLGVVTLVSFKNTHAFQGAHLQSVRALCSVVSLAIAYQLLEVFQQKTLVTVMERLCAALEDKDPFAAGHSQRAGSLAMLLASRLGLPKETLEELRLGMALHDIGKVAIPDTILHKAGTLSNEEFELMKSHTTVGFNICRPLMLSPTVLMIIRSHHEKLDGTGYPDGLKGDELPLPVRIAGVAIAYDAMKSKRSWREALSPSDTIAELTKTAGRQFDPVVVQTLRSVLSESDYLTIYPEDGGFDALEAA